MILRGVSLGEEGNVDGQVHTLYAAWVIQNSPEIRYQTCYVEEEIVAK